VVKIRLKRVVIALVSFAFINVFRQNVQGFIELALLLVNSAFELDSLFIENSTLECKIMLKLCITFIDVIEIQICNGSVQVCFWCFMFNAVFEPRNYLGSDLMLFENR
jgi:hypothetical protein